MKRERTKCTILVGLCLLLVFLAGCMEEPLPTQEQTAAPTTQAPTQEPTQETTEPAPPLPLSLELPLQQEQTTVAETLVFQGTADPRYPVYINEEPVQMDETGAFIHEVMLEVGDNTVAVSYLDEVTQYSAHRRYTTAWYAHETDSTYCSGATIYAELFAREGSTVTVSFRGEEKTVLPSVNQ